MWKGFSGTEELVMRELLANGKLFVSELSERANLPPWKVSRNLKRLEIRGYVRCEVEDRHRRGRPRKFYELSPEIVGILSIGGDPR